MLDKDSAVILKAFNAVDIPAFLVDEGLEIVSFNDSAAALFQYSGDDMAGRDIRELISFENPPAGEHLVSTCKKKSGESFVSRTSLIYPGNHQGRTVILAVRDITGQGKLQQMELIIELSGIINSSLSIGTIFRMMVSEIKKLINYDRASLLLYDEKSNGLLIFALDTCLETVMKKGVKAPVEGTSAGWVIKNNKPWINYDLRDTLFPLDKKLYLEGIRSTISIPLFHDKILGVFNLDSSQPSKYSETDLAILLPAAKHISIALENALLFEEISKEKKEWEKTFDAITDMVWLGDGDYRILRANAALLKKTGFSSLEVLGRTCSELLERIGIHSEGCIYADAISDDKPSFRELKGVGGALFHFWAYPLVDEEGRLYAVVYYLKDVTSQKRLEQQLIRSDKLASLGTLVAGIAHEINNPLGIIAGYSEALLERAQDKSLLGNRGFEDFPEYLETIHNEIFRCKGILRGLLDFARPSSGTFREIDINELIKEVILLVNHRAKRLNHNIELRLNRDLPKISAEPGSLRQLFMNIIMNSMYFTPERGSIIISSEMDPSSHNSGMIRVSVSDTGTGMPSDNISRVFDPFFTTKPVGEGTGLGLSICHKIVEEHNGSIDVESEEGRGTSFIIRLPSRAADD
ncbi:MAG: GAF domain-containing protein [Nitrospirae bacterium]|nr:GAF domain-containing protein [Nitrospirota bacterium]